MKIKIYKNPYDEKYFIDGKSAFTISMEGINTVTSVTSFKYYSENWVLIPEKDLKETREKIFKMFQYGLNFNN